MAREVVGSFSRVMSVALAVGLVGCDAAPLPMDLGIPQRLAEHRAETLGGLHYRITLEIPAERSEPITGRTLISFAWQDPDEQPLVLDFMEPSERVHTLKVNGAEALWEAVNDHVVIPFDALRPGSNEIDMTYDAGDDAFNRSDDFLYALFVPDRAHFSLPVFDQPNLKGAVTWKVSVPGDWAVIANGPNVDATHLNDRATYGFLETRPIPTYLFAVAAGRFLAEEKIEGDHVLRMYHRETDSAKVARNRDAIFDLHGVALDWLEEYTGIPYPFQKFEFVLIPSFQYGGMEHPGGILYRQAGIMLDEAATQGQLLGRASVIAHETSHMWFGDLVTMDWFDDVWMKEVFANFMAAKVVHPSFPDVDHDLRFLTAHFPAAYGVDRTAGANAIRQPLANLREAGTLYGSIIYQKAPIVMKQLEARVGEDVFRDGLREYLNSHAYGNATWPELIAILDARSDQDLAAWSRVWVEEAGRPRIVVERNGSRATIHQEDPAGRGRVWPQTLEVRVGTVQGSRLETVELGKNPVSLANVAAGDFVLPNGSGMEYGDVVLDSTSLDYLVAQLSELEPALVRGASWVTLWDQLLDGRLAPGRWMDAALDGLEKEDTELNLSLVLGYLRTTYWRLLSEEARREVAPRLERVLWDGVTSRRPRTERSSFFSAYRNLATTDEGVARLRRLWSGEEKLPDLPLSEAAQIGLASGLAIRGVADAEKILDEEEGRIRNADRLARFRFVRPSLSADPAERDAFFDSLRDPAHREREPWVLEGLGNLHHPLRAESSLHLIRPGLDMIEEIQRTGDIFFPGRWLAATMGGHSSSEAADTVRSFLNDAQTLPQSLKLKTLQSADMVYRAARLVHGWS